LNVFHRDMMALAPLLELIGYRLRPIVHRDGGPAEFAWAEGVLRQSFLAHQCNTPQN
jgi:hypothetical protein